MRTRIFERLSISVLAAFMVAGVWAYGARVMASDAATDTLTELAFTQFGQAVAVIDGGVLIGEPSIQGKPGAVYVYRRTGATWAAVDTLTGDRPGDGFGSSIGVAGQTLMIGAPPQFPPRGVVYVYERAAGGEWRRSARLTPDDTTGQNMFGASVALSGDVALIGAPLEDSIKGSVYVFRRSANGWERAGKFTASDAAGRTGFGFGLALDGERALITAPGRGVYAFRHENGTWRELGKLPLEPTVGFFTTTPRLAGDRAFVGARNADQGQGAVFLFTSDAAGAWTAAGRIAPPDTTAKGFGAGLVVLSDNRLWIGAPGANGGRGAAMLYGREGTGDWRQSQTLQLADAKRTDGFGVNLSYAGNVLVSGMVQADYGAGKAAIFQGDPLAHVATLFTEEEEYDAVTGKEIKCAEANGKASVFPCGDVDLLAFLPISKIGGERGVHLNDIWGWTDPQTNKEYALVGRINGTSFVDVTDPVNPVYLGDLPMTEGAQANFWRDIKVYKDHAFIVADGAGKHGVQVFDLTKLRGLSGAPKQFTEDAHYDRIFSAHNIVINEESGFAYTVGSGMGGETCGGGLHMIDIREPKNPKFAGCFADTQTGTARTGYSHDAQCVTYRGPDRDYQGREICIGSNETHLSIADVTDKASPKAVSRASYPNVGYTHQGWFTDDQRYFLVDDEGDEVSGTVPRTRTLVWDLTDLDDPILVKEFLGTTPASDHNLYVKGNLVFQSNYTAGLRILDITDPLNPVEVGFLDVMPDGNNEAGFNGSWSNYPYFKSGTIVVTGIEQGLFIVRKAPTRRVISQ
jgi:choice-of-anchor B domain-containing protein